ncbi:MAG: Asd/ArgC dimerization domain-containing protein, partial [Cyclobacteriaceae bacterium]
LSQDYRLADKSEGFTYGLPEFQRDKIKSSDKIANPGCFATGIQLALLPLVKSGLITRDIHINGITGSTGAGQSLSPTSHFSWRNNNISLYKEFEHQHLFEIRETLVKLQENLPELMFLPVRGNFTRGIFVSAYTECAADLSEVQAIYESFYRDTPFTHVSKEPLHLKQVVNTNNCFVHVTVKKGNVLVTSVIDNLLKGASGQAVQNMNLMFGLNESEGLHLKSSSF